MSLYWKYYIIMGRKCLRKQNNLDSLCYFIQQMLNFCTLSISQLSKRYWRKLEFLISTLDRISLCVTRSFICLYVNNTTCFSAVHWLSGTAFRRMSSYSIKLQIYFKIKNQIHVLKFPMFQAIHQNGGFTKVWFSLKTVLFPMILSVLVWYWRRISMLTRQPNLLERLVL